MIIRIISTIILYIASFLLIGIISLFTIEFISSYFGNRPFFRLDDIVTLIFVGVIFSPLCIPGVLYSIIIKTKHIFTFISGGIFGAIFYNYKSDTTYYYVLILLLASAIISVIVSVFEISIRQIHLTTQSRLTK